MTMQAVSRRTVVRAWLALPAVALLARVEAAVAQSGTGAGTPPGNPPGTPSVAGKLALTPACGAPEPFTQAQTEGPFFIPRSPERRDFRADAGPGEPMALVGLVLDRNCRPVPRALVELWHADASGQYDNRGYRLRGHQFADPQGRFAFETIRPGRYPGRTQHFHVKVQPPGGPVLTTQLYFPEEPGNRRDGIFDPSLVIAITPVDGGAAEGSTVGRFDFVVATA